MKATLKPTDPKPGVFGLTIEDITAQEAKGLLVVLERWWASGIADWEVTTANHKTLRPVLLAGIAAVVHRGKEGTGRLR